MKNIRSMLMLAGLLACLSTVAVAAPGQVKEQKVHHAAWRGLELTEEQRAQIREIRKEGHQEKRKSGQKPANASLQPFIEAEYFDEAAVRAVLEQQLEQRLQMAAQQHRIYQLLTAEQKAQLAEQQKRRGERTAEKMPRKGKEK